MTGTPLRVTMAALLVIVIALGVALGVKLSRGPTATSRATTGPSATDQAPTGRATTGRTTARPTLTWSQMIATFPKRAGSLQLESTQGTALAVNFVPLPECFGPTSTAGGTAVKTLPKIDSDIAEPVVSGTYGGDVDGFDVQLFRFSQSKLTEVTGLIKGAPAHCTQVRALNNGAVDVNERLNLPIGEESAVYRTYKAVSAHRTDIRVPSRIELVALSKGWGVTMSTEDYSDTGGSAIKQARLMAQGMPDFLQGLDQALGTSFWPAKGTTAVIAFPAPTPYVAGNGKANTPVYEPTSYWISQDASLEVTDLQWTSWTAVTATASGIAEINSCVPNCAGGTWHKYSVRVNLSQPDDSCEYAYFERLRLHWLAGKPSGFEDETFSILPDHCDGI